MAIIICMETKFGATRDTVYEYAENQYGSLPEHLWTTFPLYSVFRRQDNKKWYAIVMNIKGNKLGLDSDEYVDIVDVKCDPTEKDELLTKRGFLPAYHLSRKTWITVMLDGTVDPDTLFRLIDKSYDLARGKRIKN